MDNITIPFNSAPVDTDSDSSSNYTVPAGKYALVTISLSASAAFNDLSNASTNPESVSFTSNTNSNSIQIWMKAGDVLSKSESAAAGTITGPFQGVEQISRSSTATVSVDTGSGANEISRVVATAVVGISTPNLNSSITISGEADVGWFVQEFDVIS